MESKKYIRRVSELYDIAVFDISRNLEKWVEFLEFSGRGNIYRFDFMNQCLVFEQRRDAEVLMDYDNWKKVKRYVRREEIGIAVFPIEMLGNVKYLYDIKSTGGRVTPFIWEINEDNAEKFADQMFPEYYDKNDQNKNFRKAIKNFTRTYVCDIMEEKTDILQNLQKLKTEIRPQDNSDIFKFVLQSTMYLVLKRCGIDSFDAGLDDIVNFQDERILSRIGNLISDMSESVLREFAKVAWKIRKEERSLENGRSGIHEGIRRNALSGSSNGGNGVGSEKEFREIRKESTQISVADGSEQIRRTSENREIKDRDASKRGRRLAVARPDNGIRSPESDRKGENQSGEYNGNDDPAQSSWNDSRRNRSEGSNLSEQLLSKEKQKGTADVVPFLVQDITPHDIPEELLLYLIAYVMESNSHLSSLFIEKEDEQTRKSVLETMYDGEELDIRWRNNDTIHLAGSQTGLNIYWNSNNSNYSGYTSYETIVSKIASLEDEKENRTNRAYEDAILLEGIRRLMESNLNLISQEMIVDVMTTNILPQQKLDFLIRGSSYDFPVDTEQKITLSSGEDVIFKTKENGMDFIKNESSGFIGWDLVRDALMKLIENGDYPPNRELSNHDITTYMQQKERETFIQKYHALFRQIGENPSVIFPAIEERPKKTIAEASPYYQQAVKSYVSTALFIPIKPLLQSLIEDGFKDITTEFLRELFSQEPFKTRKEAAVNQYGLVQYEKENDTIHFKGLFNKDEVAGTFGYLDMVSAIEDLVKQQVYMDIAQYRKACEEGFSFCPDVAVQLYREIINRNRKQEEKEIAVVSDFYYPEKWEIQSGDKTRYKNNVAAIKLLKELESQRRPATYEEQIILASYVGWGGIANAFNEDNPNWSKEYNELKELLSDEEYRDARGTVNTAFYTPPQIISAIYSAVQKFGFQEGKIFEPGLGVGNFFNSLPENMRESELFGVEKDSISGRIARQLHPHANIQIKGFEETNFKNDSYDLILGNVPFGDFKVFDPEYKKYNFKIHDYFLAKSIDLLRPGGITAVLTSKGTMDKQKSDVRRYLAERADLIGAIRLPGSVFSKSAGAEVTTDILFLQKKLKRELIPENTEWLYQSHTDDNVPINAYFSEHPEMMLGKMVWDDHTYGKDSAYTQLIIEDPETFNLESALKSAIENLHADYIPAEHLKNYIVEAEDEKEVRKVLPADPEVKNGTFTVIDHEIYYRENEEMYLWEGGDKPRERILGLHEIRKATRHLITIQTEGCTTDELLEGQEKLNTLYDIFVEKYGFISSRGNKMAFRDDSDYYLLCSLEIADGKDQYKKADMFYKQTILPKTTIERVDTAVDALKVSLAEYSNVHIPYMLSVYHVEREILLRELQGMIYKNPLKADEDNPDAGWEVAAEYLSGEVRKKLRVAKQYAKTDPQYSINVEALEQVQPEDLKAADIDVKLGTPWVRLEDYNTFVYELLGTPAKFQEGTQAIEVKLHKSNMNYAILNKAFDYRSVAARETYGTGRVNAYTIIESVLNQRIITVKDKIDTGDSTSYVVNTKETMLAREKAGIIKDKFKEWLWEDAERRKFYVDFYNETFNGTVLRTYDGSYLTFPGMNPEIKFRPHQYNAVARTLEGSTLLAHAVGAGKSFTMAASCMELKRLGLMHKGMIVVPNHLVDQMASEFLRLYPAANLLVAKDEDFQKANRRKFTSKIATNNFDAIIIGHSQFERIPISKERREAMLEEQIEQTVEAIEEIKDENGENWTIKQMEAERKRLEEKLLELRNDNKKDDVLNFEELGVDGLYVDEAHCYKNLAIFSKINNVAGIAKTGSQRAMDMYLKVQYLHERTGGRNVVFATGTPISNTMCELYVMQLYLQKQLLEEKELRHFDAWAATYGEITTALEMTPEGSGYRYRSRFNKFSNLPELITMFRMFADVQLSEMLDLKVPKLRSGKYQIVESTPDEETELVMADLARRAENIRNGNVDPSIDNMLKITNEARLLGTDIRLLDPDAESNPDGKLFKVVENVYKEYMDSEEIRGTQVIFSDIGTPTGKKDFNIYDFIKQELIKKGIPEEEIAFIHDAKTKPKKKALFADMRSGKKRILIGSTGMMGTGTNIQDRLVAAHHVDCPWKPSDIEQRDGRIIRQGNMNEEVEIYRYVTKRTFDAYLWGILENKQQFISQIMTNKVVSRECEDVDEVVLSFAEIKAVASGNPLILEKTDVDNEVTKLKMLKAMYQNQKYVFQDNFLFKFPEQIKETELKLDALRKDKEKRDMELQKDAEFRIEILGKIYDDRETAGSVIVEIAKSLETMKSKKIGSYKGFELSLEKKFSDVTMLLGGSLTYKAEMGSSISGNIIRIENLLSGLEKREQKFTEAVKEYKRNLEDSKNEYDKPFQHELKLQQLLKRQKEINEELEIKEDGQEMVIGEEKEPMQAAR